MPTVSFLRRVHPTVPKRPSDVERYAIQRIAVFRALQLGDLLCAVPALRALRAAWPRAHITLIGLPWARDFVRRFDSVDAFLEFPGFPGLPERPAELELLPKFFAAAQAQRFDLAIQLHGSGGITNALVSAMNARYTAGFHAPGAWCPDPERFLPWPEQLPEPRRLLALSALLGAPASDESLELPVLPEERRAFVELLPQLPAGRSVCVHAGARLASRRWPAERFAEVADRLAVAGYVIVLTGAADEAPLLAQVQAHMQAPALNLAGRTSLGTLALVLARASLVICNDTGVSHVAAATRTPSVVVSCGADVARWRPLDRARHRVLWQDLACRPCAHEHCPYGHPCALAVSVAMVTTQALQLLSLPSKGKTDWLAAAEQADHVQA